jgi:hypothetical protein
LPITKISDSIFQPVIFSVDEYCERMKDRKHRL